MSPEERTQWQEASRLFEALLDMPEGERDDWLQAQDLEPGIQKKLEFMLRADTDPDPSLEQGKDWVIREVGDIELGRGLEGRTIGAWTLDEKIGEGGMSTVYRCHRQVEDAVQVAALKLLRIGLLTTEGKARFQREIRIIAGLQHSAIARLLDAGAADDGTPFLVLEFVEGRPIDAFADGGGLEQHELVELFLSVCDAVAHAQQRLIVHRDIKPSNILVNTDGHPRLLDFGIARLIDEEQAAVTTTRAYTPGYAAPEQLSGGAVTLATDVFGLGATLFRLLTGESARDAERNENEYSPPRFDPSFNRDLKNILQRAMHADPARRYRDAATLAEDLHRWQAGRPVAATGDALSYRVRKFVARNRLAAVAGMLLVLTATAGIAATLWQSTIAEREAHEALASSARAEALNEFLVGLFEATEAGRVARDDLPTTAELLDLAAVRARNEFQQQPQLRAQMLRTVGRIYMTQGRHEEAEGLLLEAIEVLDAQEESDLLQRSAAYEALARTLLRDGREVAAIERAEQALNSLSEIEVDHLDQRRALTDVLVTAQLTRDEVEQALNAARSLQQSIQDVAPDRSSLLAQAKLLLAQIYNHQGDTESALPLLQQAWALAEPLTGQLELKSSILNSLSIALKDQGQLTEAATAGEQSLALIRQAFPPGHARIGRALNGLASMQNQLGRLEAATASSEEALEILLAALGDDHLSVAAAYNNLGKLLGDLQRHEEALDAYREANRIVDQRLAPDDWRRVILLLNEASALINLLRFEEAGYRLERATELAASGTREDQMRTVWSMRAKLHVRADQPAEAERAALEAVAAGRERFPDGSSFTAVSLGRLALAQQSLGKLEQAQLNLVAAERELAKLAGEFDSPAREYIQDRTRFLSISGDSGQAADWLERDLESLERALGQDHPSLPRFREQIVGLREGAAASP